MHWYLNNARFQPLKADGKPYVNIPAKVVEEAGAVPGTTDILSSFGKAFWMPKYFGELAVQAALSVAKESLENNETFDDDRLFERGMSRFWSDSDEPAKRGSLIHWALEQHFEGGDPFSHNDETYHEAFRNAIAAVDGEVAGLCPSGTLALAERQFSTPTHGGTIDLTVLNSEGVRVGLFDFKTVKSKRPPRISEIAQLVTYLDGDNMLDPETKMVNAEDIVVANIYIDSSTGKLFDTYVWNSDEMEIGREFFKVCYDAYTIDKGFNKRWKQD